jgi:hypothetical protein
MKIHLFSIQRTNIFKEHGHLLRMVHINSMCVKGVQFFGVCRFH